MAEKLNYIVHYKGHGSYNTIKKLSDGNINRILEARVCTSGSLQGVLAGSHCNRSWNVHNIA